MLNKYETCPKCNLPKKPLGWSPSNIPMSPSDIRSKVVSYDGRVGPIGQVLKQAIWSH